MRILITGGAGFIGSHIADKAIAQGMQVAIVDNLSTGHQRNIPANAEFFEVDIRERDALGEVFREFKPTAVSHQAAQASVSLSVREPVLDAGINVIGSLNVIEASIEQKVDRFIFASTGGAIYGEVPDGVRATETTPPNPLSPYAVSKMSVEHYLAAARYEHQLNYTILRYANVYGPRQDPHGEAGVVAIFLEKLLANAPIQINARTETGDDGCVRDYVFINDVAAMNVAAVTETGLPNIINVSSGVPTSTKALAETLQSLLQSSSEFSFAARRAGDVERSVLDPELLIGCGITPTSLTKGLRLLVSVGQDLS